MTFPGFLIFLPPKFPTSTPLGWGGQFFLGRNHPQIYPHIRAKFGNDRSGSLAA